MPSQRTQIKVSFSFCSISRIINALAYVGERNGNEGEAKEQDRWIDWARTRRQKIDRAAAN